MTLIRRRIRSLPPGQSVVTMVWEPFDIGPDGTVHAPARPGLGFKLRKDALERFQYVEGPEFVF
jgi:L-alanine-DL-glutamate epimerase-like enolase superfamily enzyme